MKLQRHGLVYGSNEFAPSSHAQVPTAFALDDRIRLFYAARDARGKSFTAFVDLDIEDPFRVLANPRTSVLAPGAPGTFDEDGNMPSQVLRDGKRLLMYYSGWNQKVSTPYHNSTGLAESWDDGMTFQRVFEGPVMERSAQEPYVVVTPSVLRDESGYRCWYISGLRWVLVAQKYEPVYVVKSAHSTDGIHWIRDGRQVIPSRFENEAFSRPTVFQKNGNYHMLFCARGSEDYRNGSQAYRLGYARSKDGVEWQRLDEELEIAGERGEWESKMMCYPFHVKIGEKDFIFYNGNGFGQSGFGLAEVGNV